MLTTQQAAKLWGVKEITVIKWIKRGKLKAEKHGRDWAIPEQDKPKDRRCKK
jgi:excisionase family DNA binding protein